MLTLFRLEFYHRRFSDARFKRWISRRIFFLQLKTNCSQCSKMMVLILYILEYLDFGILLRFEDERNIIPQLSVIDKKKTNKNKRNICFFCISHDYISLMFENVNLFSFHRLWLRYILWFSSISTIELKNKTETENRAK